MIRDDFGLGSAASIDRIEVSWPSGSTSTLDENLTIDDLIEIIEPAG